jgi:hypothetical protein
MQHIPWYNKYQQENVGLVFEISEHRQKTKIQRAILPCVDWYQYVQMLKCRYFVKILGSKECMKYTYTREFFRIQSCARNEQLQRGSKSSDIFDKAKQDICMECSFMSFVDYHHTKYKKLLHNQVQYTTQGFLFETLVHLDLHGKLLTENKA